MTAATRPPTVGRFAAGLVGLFVVSTLGWMAVWALGTTLVYGHAPVAVSSGSMAPALDVGDLVVVEPYHGQGVRPGAVVVFDEAGTGRSVIHRVVEVHRDGTFTTKGDANPAKDSTPLELERIESSGRFLLPRLGLPVVWAQQGRWLLVVLALFGLIVAVRLTRFAVFDAHDPWLAGVVPPVPAETSLGSRLHTSVGRLRDGVAGVGLPRWLAGATRRRAAEIGAVALALVFAHATVTAYAAFAVTTTNVGNQFASDSLAAPTGLSASAAGCGASSGIVHVSTSSATNSANGQNVVISRPSGIAVGQLLVAQVSFHTHSFVGSISPPSGWTTIRVDNDTNHEIQGVFWKLVTASEPATYTFTNTTADTGKEGSGGIVVYDGVDAASPIDAHAAATLPAGGSTITAPSVTTTVPGTTLLTLLGQRANGPITPPTGMVERFEVTSSNQNLSELSDQPISAAGATGTRVVTSADNGSSVVQTVALRPRQVTPVGVPGIGSSPNGSAGALVLPVPAAAQAGDLLLAHVVVHTHSFGANPLPSPPGWNLVRLDWDNAHLVVGVFRRFASASEPGSYTFTNNSGDTTQQATGAIFAFRGVDPGTPVDASAGTASTSGSDTLVAPSVTTTRSNSRLVSLVGVYGNSQGPATPPASMTEIYEDTVTNELAVVELLGEAASEPLIASGSTGTRSITVPQTDSSVAQTIALRPYVGEASVNLSWTPSTSPMADGYTVERWVGSTLQATTTVTPGTASAYTDGPLSVGTTYSYKVITTAGTWRSTAATTTFAPAAC